MSFASDRTNSLNGANGGGLVGFYNGIYVYYLQVLNPNYTGGSDSGGISTPHYIGVLWAVSGTLDVNTFTIVPDGVYEKRLSAQNEDVILAQMQGDFMKAQFGKYVAYTAIPISDKGQEVVFTQTQSGDVVTQTYPYAIGFTETPENQAKYPYSGSLNVVSVTDGASVLKVADNVIGISSFSGQLVYTIDSDSNPSTVVITGSGVSPNYQYNPNVAPTNVSVSVGDNALFTTKLDNVNFNSLTLSQSLAITADPSIMYSDFGGNGDQTTLPTLAKMISLNWNQSIFFKTGSLQNQAYKLVATDANYNIALGAGLDELTLTGDGQSSIFIGTGADKITINGKGKYSINGNTGSSTITLTGTGTTTLTDSTGVNVVSVGKGGTLKEVGTNAFLDTVTLSGATLDIANTGSGKAGKIDFGAGSSTVTIEAGAKLNAAIGNFSPSQTISFLSQDPQHLTFSSYSTVKGEIDVYSGKTQVATLIFSSSVDEEALKPLIAGNAVTITLDPTNPSVPDPGGTKIDWAFMHAREGQVKLAPYVPSVNNPETMGHSGVTVATGVDLGSGPINAARFKELFPDYAANPNLLFLYNAIGKQGANAQTYLSSNGESKVAKGNLESLSASITKAQANTLTGAAEELTLADLERTWDHSPLWNGGRIVHFTDLPAGAQTALYDVAYQYGATNLPKKTPTFWKLMIEAAKTVTTTNVNGDPAAWTAVWSELINFGDAFGSRRLLDAEQIAPLTNGTPPKIILAPPQSSTPESTTFALAIDPTQQYVFGSSSDTTMTAAASAFLATPTLRPSPDSQSYVLALGAGSPAISLLQLPYEGAAFYQVDFRTAAGASLSLQTYQPGQAISVPTGVQTIVITSLDANLWAQVSQFGLSFNVKFATSGTASVTVTPPAIGPSAQVQDIVVDPNGSVSAFAMISGLSNPNGHDVLFYRFWDGGTGGGHFAYNGTIYDSHIWINVVADATALASLKYVGGPSTGSETISVEVYDNTTATWSASSSLTAKTAAPLISVNVNDASLLAGGSIAASAMIASVTKPSADKVTAYEFWTDGNTGGHFEVGGLSQPSGAWVSVSASALTSLRYVSGSPGAETVLVAAYDETTSSWSDTSMLTVTTSSPPNIHGTLGNETLHAGAGLLSADGGGGHDSIVFTGQSNQYTITKNSDHSVTIADLLNGRDGTVTTVAIEVLNFTDKTIFVENADNANIARLYSAALGRAPDQGGLFGWEDIYTNNISSAAKAGGVYLSLAQTNNGFGTSIAGGFTQSPEFLAKYGALNDAGFVSQLYLNVLGRSPATAELNAWLDIMHNSGFTRDMVLVGFAESPENIAKTAADWLIQI